jgi:hypothetical protein
MVRMSLPPVALCAVTIAVAACDAAGPLPEFDDRPMVALLITPVSPPRLGGAPPDSGLYAALLTTGTPVRAPYLRAERFEMRRVSDGALFAWRPIAVPQEAAGVIPNAYANYFLPRLGGESGLGSDSLAPGEVYELVVEAGPHRIVGRTRVPGPIEFVREPTDGDSIVRWRRTPGAAGYGAGGDFFFSDLAPLATDTVFVVRREPPFPGQSPRALTVRVFAFDSNYAALHGDVRVSQAGITGGWGVFGSFTWADAELPPQAGHSTAP